MSAPVHRRGALLILIAGISAMLMAVCLAFLARMRADGEEGALLLAEAQSRLMLHAAMSYVSEGARIGWDDPGTPAIEEAFGWTDVRDGAIGPRGADRQRLWHDDDAFPAPGGRAARCPMHVLERPPYAIYPAWNPNPVSVDPALAVDRIAQFHESGRSRPDPEPAATTWAEFAAPPAALREPRIATLNRAWFRVWREPDAYHNGVVDQAVDGRTDWWDTIALPGHHGIFIVACGAGGSNGYRDAAEAAADPDSPAHLRDPGLFAIVRAAERILWYRVEWSPSVGQTLMDYERWGNRKDDFWYDRYPPGGIGQGLNAATILPPVDATAGTAGGQQDSGRETARNLLGTFSWVQRLDREPPRW